MNQKNWKSPAEILSLVMVMLTGVSVWTSIRATSANKEAVEVMKHQILAATRPYVVADFVEKDGETYFELSNRGTTSAHDVKLVFDTVLRAEIDGISFPSKLAVRPISLMTPGTTYRELLKRLSKNEEASMSKHSLTIFYQDSTSNSYQEKCVLTILGKHD